MFVGLVYLPFFKTLLVASDEKYAGHVIFVPFVAAALFWLERDRIRRRDEHSTRTLAVLLLGLALFSLGIGYWTNAVALQAISLILLAAGSLMWLYGPRGVRASSFVLAYLLFMIPPPHRLIAEMAAHLQDVVAAVSAPAVRALQIPVERQGIFLQLPGITLEVTEGCAGVRFLLILFVLGTAFARASMPTTSGQVFLMFVSIPIAMFANTLRVVTITAGSHIVGPHVATGPLHYYIGKGCWVLAFIAFIAVAAVLRSRLVEGVPFDRTTNSQTAGAY